MSPRRTEASDEAEAPHPRSTFVLHGHAAADTALLEAYRSGRIPHAVLLAGPKGIGKATLAYRLARFVLAYPDPTASAGDQATSLAVDPGHPVARRISAQAQRDLLILERMPNDKGVLRQKIAVDDVRRTVSFFGSTPGEGGWRIAIVDVADELSVAGANALLKILEEPPPRALLILVANSLARVSATLRSRCRIIALRALATADVAAAAAAATGRRPDDPAVVAAAATGEGSVWRALGSLRGDLSALRQQTMAALDRLPQVDAKMLHALGDSMMGTDPEPLAAFLDTINLWLSRRLDGGRGDLGAMVRLADASAHINQAARDAETYNLERKPLVFSAFSLLAAATSG